MGKQKTQDAQTVDINGKKLTCQFCNNDRFWMRKALLNKASSTLMNLDWADKSATCFVCSECSHIHWFLL